MKYINVTLVTSYSTCSIRHKSDVAAEKVLLARFCWLSSERLKVSDPDKYHARKCQSCTLFNPLTAYIYIPFQSQTLVLRLKKLLPRLGVVCYRVWSGIRSKGGTFLMVWAQINIEKAHVAGGRPHHPLLSHC